jgi:pyruvate ferredoxin oxidoreductase delta subunit
MKPKFIQKACTACKMCYTICPEGCVSARWVSATRAEKNSFQVDYDYCKGCGLCVEVCPVKDEIVMVEEQEPAI